ncbi:MAG: hypothetical protein NW224_21285 [Leptolyngbyaceae cyanobacterium bins.302]|nr:hypothetical protein [Leptolyngbyaceae cyanobacterium bins.302]
MACPNRLPSLPNVHRSIAIPVEITLKRGRIVLFGLLMGVWLGGCNPQITSTQPQQREGSNPPAATDPARKDKKVILTTFTVLADMAQNVAGDKAIVDLSPNRELKFTAMNLHLAIWNGGKVPI